MVIDINILRPEKGGNIETVRESEKARGRDCVFVDEVIDADEKWRKAIFEMERCKRESNEISKAIGERRKKNKNDTCEDLKQKSLEIKSLVPEAEACAVEWEKKRDALLHKIGNIVHKSVPVHNDEQFNKVVRSWGNPLKLKIDGTPGHAHHHEILAKLNGYEAKKGAELAGHRGYFLKGVGAMLNHALIQYGLSFLRRRNYLTIQPPFFLRKEVMAETAELKDFEETLYRIPTKEKDMTGDKKDADRDDLFLIATSEQPIAALHRNEFIEERTLPLRYGGSSTCFRKEAGSSGKDVWGLYRVHQFEKVEQFCVTTPETSWEMHDEMVETAEEFYKSLEIPYRVVAIVSGALNDAAAKKYDIEGWFPGYEEFRELVSCSNCTDYQSRSLNVRLGHPKQGDKEKRFVHMLNSTLVASQRCMCCVLENYQTPEGVKVPTALVPYMDGLEFLPFPV